MLPTLVLLAAAQARAPSEPTPLQRMTQAMQGRRAMECELSYTSYGHPDKGRFRVLSPNCVWMQTSEFLSATDGKSGWDVNLKEKTWAKKPPASVLNDAKWLPGFGLLLEGAAPTQATGEAKAEKFENEDVVAVPISAPGPAPSDVKVVLLLSSATWLPRAMRVTRAGTGSEPEVTELFRFENIRLDPPLTPADFRYTPPADFRDREASPPLAAAEAQPAAPVPRATILGRPDAWIKAGPSSLRAGSKVRIEGAHWVIDVQARDAKVYDWRHAEMTMRCGDQWVPAALQRQSNEGKAAAVAARRANHARPWALRLRVPLLQDPKKRLDVTIDWRAK